MLIRSLYLTGVLLLVAAFTNQITTEKLTEERKLLESADPNYASTQQVEQQLDCLTLNIYKEAGREPFEGKVAIAQVTINRTKNDKFPDDICAVVYQKNYFMKTVVCQFSWYCNRVHKNRPIDQKQYEESYAVAKKVLLEGFRLESLREALFYHADYVNPNWRYQRIIKIGTHIFYKERPNA